MSSPDVIRYPGFQPYEAAWAEQRRLHAARVNEEIPDTVMLLEHEPVYTGRQADLPVRTSTGRRWSLDDRRRRGGKITWHGPGQIVGYPIVRLPEPVDVVAFVRRVEQVLIDVRRARGRRRPSRDARPQRGLAAGRRPGTGPEGGRHRPSVANGVSMQDARQLRLRPGLVLTDHPVRHFRRRCHVAVRRAGPPSDGRRPCRSSSAICQSLLALPVAVASTGAGPWVG